MRKSYGGGPAEQRAAQSAALPAVRHQDLFLMWGRLAAQCHLVFDWRGQLIDSAWLAIAVGAPPRGAPVLWRAFCQRPVSDSICVAKHKCQEMFQLDVGF